LETTIKHKALNIYETSVPFLIVPESCFVGCDDLLVKSESYSVKLNFTESERRHDFKVCLVALRDALLMATLRVAKPIEICFEALRIRNSLKLLLRLSVLKAAVGVIRLQPSSNLAKHPYELILSNSTRD
jgi:hypothetical protein